MPKIPCNSPVRRHPSSTIIERKIIRPHQHVDMLLLLFRLCSNWSQKNFDSFRRILGSASHRKCISYLFKSAAEFSFTSNTIFGSCQRAHSRYTSLSAKTSLSYQSRLDPVKSMVATSFRQNCLKTTFIQNVHLYQSRSTGKGPQGSETCTITSTKSAYQKDFLARNRLVYCEGSQKSCTQVVPS